MNQLETIIRQRMREQGPVLFRDFMEWAMYEPEWGYYQKPNLPFGKAADFYTAPGVHPVFAETVALDLLRRWQQLGRSAPFTVVEYGAGTGSLARQILDALRSRAPDFYSALRYRIAERSAHLRSVQQAALAGHPADWVEDASRIGPLTGVVLANELVDALPVHVVEQTGSGLREVYVTETNGRFQEWLGPVSDGRIVWYVEQFVGPLENGQRAEVNLEALEWLDQVAGLLACGWVITIDYGEAELLYQGRMKGTLRTFSRHQPGASVLEAVGEQDITTDVNFSALMKYGDTAGLKTVFYGTQGKFLAEAGIFQLLSAPAETDPFRDEAMKRNLAIKHLVLPGGMGERFKVLVQQKNV